MGALALPKALSIASAKEAILKHIGVRVNGIDMERTIAAYDVEQGWARKLDGTMLHGTIEPFWR